MLTQQGVFCHQFGLASGKVSQRRKQQRGGVGFGPGEEAVVQRLKATICQQLEKGGSPSFRGKYPSRRGESGEEWLGGPLWSPVVPL